MKIDLASEMEDAGRSATVEHYQRLVALGCPIGAIASLARRYQPLGVCKVRWLPGGLYEPDESCEPAVIMAVVEDDGGIFTPDPFDLIAWQTSRPRRWAWRVGLAPALGEHLIAECDVLPVVATPLDWLALGGECLCILDWQAPAQFWLTLRTGPRLIVQTEELRRKLRVAMTRSVVLPEMEVACAA